FLCQLQHPRIIGFRKPEDGENDVQWKRHRNVASEIALASEFDHSIDRRSGQSGQTLVKPRQTLRKEPIGRDTSQCPVLRIVDVDECAEQVAVLGNTLVVGFRSEHGARLVTEDVVSQLDRQHIGVARDRMERIEVVMLDQVHRISAPEHRAGLVKQLLICVSGRRDEYLTGFLD
ncbi:MAG: hypothetical protein RIQ64_536, partial [Actinomycetota bacterium]